MGNSYQNYKINYTVESRSPISIHRSFVVNDLMDITLIGKRKLEYGEEFNTNILRLLEHFAAFESPTTPNTPNLESVYLPLLNNPIVGQIWYNKSKHVPYTWNGYSWDKLSNYQDVAGNSGVIAHGEQLPKPMDNDGNYFEYDTCSWSVSPFGFEEDDRIVYISCYTDANAKVFMEYLKKGDTSPKYGMVNYQIIGITDSFKHGVPASTPNIPGLTPTPTMTPTQSRPPTPTRTPVPTRTPGVTVSASPTPTSTRPATPEPSVSATPSPSMTPTPTVTPTITPSSVPSWIIVNRVEELLPYSQYQGYPCTIDPPKDECHIGVLGNNIVMISECPVGDNMMIRTTVTYECSVHAGCVI